MRRVGVWGLVFCLVAAPVLQVMLVFASRVRLAGPQDAAEVHLGLPLAWIVQDQTRYDPPYPWTAHLQSPWENPTEILVVPMVLNGALLVCACYLVASAVVAVTRRAARTG